MSNRSQGRATAVATRAENRVIAEARRDHETRTNYPTDPEKVKEITQGLGMKGHGCSNFEMSFFRAAGEAFVNVLNAERDEQVTYTTARFISEVFKQPKFRDAFKELIASKTSDSAQVIKLPIADDNWAVGYFADVLEAGPRVLPRHLKETFVFPELRLEFIGVSRRKSEGPQESAPALPSPPAG